MRKFAMERVKRFRHYHKPPITSLTEGWSFEGKLILKVFLILGIGLLISSLMYPDIWIEMKIAKHPTLGQFLFIYILFNAILIFIRRWTFYQSHKERYAHYGNKDAYKQAIKDAETLGEYDYGKETL